MSDAALLALRASGWIAALTLLAAISATPLGRLAKRALRMRRALGIASAIAALIHGSLSLAIYVTALPAIASVAWLRSGALALALLVPLLATSFPSLVRRLGVRLWKPLHRLAYVAAALVVHHVLLSPFAPRTWGVALAALLVVLALARARRDRTDHEEEPHHGRAP